MTAVHYDAVTFDTIRLTIVNGNDDMEEVFLLSDMFQFGDSKCIFQMIVKI